MLAVNTLQVDFLLRKSPGVQLEITKFGPEGDIDSALHRMKPYTNTGRSLITQMIPAYLHRLELQRTHGAVDLTLPTQSAKLNLDCGFVHLVTRS